MGLSEPRPAAPAGGPAPGVPAVLALVGAGVPAGLRVGVRGCGRCGLGDGLLVRLRVCLRVRVHVL
ncbi:hypothetical protein, partial [Streptomyces cacaoi]|uniref:hypothetical protein n=1 Tax=Streptomyces cacaoi TaxID=1898 RepID=UPI001BB29F26